MNERPTHKERASARADAIQFLAAHPDHGLAPALRILVESTAPPTKAEAIPVMVKHANEAGKWPGDADDEQRAAEAIDSDDPATGWDASNWAQWKTITHFMGGGT